jgi:hypothetical protein
MKRSDCSMSKAAFLVSKDGDVSGYLKLIACRNIQPQGPHTLVFMRLEDSIGSGVLSVLLFFFFSDDVDDIFEILSNRLAAEVFFFDYSI